MRACLIMILVVATGAGAAPQQQLSLGSHVAGGIFGTTLGFGLGHRIQGRWWHGAGWGFTLSQMYALYALGTNGQSRSHTALYTLLALKLAEIHQCLGTNTST